MSVSDYGFVRRARFCYLYTQSGTRLTDLCQAGGRAILGWNCGSANTAFENVFNRGVHVGAPWVPGAGDTAAAGIVTTEEEHRLERAVRALFAPPQQNAPQFHVTLVRADAIPPALPQWRPWSGDTSVDTSDALYFLPPFPLASDWAIVVTKTIPPASGAIHLPPCFLAGITRSIYDLIAELPKRGEAGWARYDRYLTPFWERRGPYLYPKVCEAEYPAFVARCLDAHLVISPRYGVPSIIPWGANPGDFTLLGCNAYG
jgi:hypothetical protein